jgi:polar amino acid transport system permease protein
MSMETVSQPGMTAVDPDLSMGLELLAAQNRERLIHSVKVGVVWVGLVALLAAMLLGVHVDPTYAAEHYGFVLQGVLTTLWVSFASICFATCLGLFGALGRQSHNSIAQGLSGFYISVFRATPLLIQLLIIFLGLPQIGRRVIALGFVQLGELLTLTATQSGILALGLNYGAYMTEVFRAGLESVGHGQREAAQAMGMSRGQMLRRVVLPQAIRVVIPNVGNYFISMQKDSALVSIVGIWEITFRANRFARKDNRFIEMLLTGAAFYWIITLVSSWLQSQLERRMAHAYER